MFLMPIAGMFKIATGAPGVVAASGATCWASSSPQRRVGVGLRPGLLDRRDAVQVREEPEQEDPEQDQADPGGVRVGLLPAC